MRRRRERVVGGEQRDVAAKAIEDEREIVPDRKGGESGHHVDAAGAGEDVHRPAEGVGIDARDGAMQILPIVAERAAEAGALEVSGDVAFADRIAGARQLAAHELAHPLLQVRKAVEAEPIGETHDGRGIDPERRRHLVDGRERHRLRVLDDVLRDALLRLRETVVTAAELVDDVAGAGRFGGRPRFGLADRHGAFLFRPQPASFRGRLDATQALRPKGLQQNSLQSITPAGALHSVTPAPEQRRNPQHPNGFVSCPDIPLRPHGVVGCAGSQ